jgi:hypothetical protein
VIWSLPQVDIAVANADMVLANVDIVVPGIDIVAPRVDIVRSNSDMVARNSDIVRTNADIAISRTDITIIFATNSDSTPVLLPFRRRIDSKRLISRLPHLKEAFRKPGTRYWLSRFAPQLFNDGMRRSLTIS